MLSVAQQESPGGCSPIPWNASPRQAASPTPLLLPVPIPQTCTQLVGMMLRLQAAGRAQEP